ncbi:breast cancer anti-estrogen resistance protein 3 homolog isoform X3 [Patella vulgata]|uniref:breast cancer anti-estrogen resistance protein 3 homolog isoform X3 n=1 Tax=Patella vulgata TaxID=6465 RepID=UPI00217FE653|nr:breast cancer anti-estrogen resistance protein 3 homolog isoform X3 [Patella vulgata]
MSSLFGLHRLVLEKRHNQQLMAHKHIAVSTWLDAIGLVEYLPHFTKYVGVEDLLYLTESEIRDLGVHNGGHRAKIVSSLRILREKYEKGRSHHSPIHSPGPAHLPPPGIQVSPPSPYSHPDYSSLNSSQEKLQEVLQRELESDPSELKSHGWYHGNISRQRAEVIVKENGDFLVRDCISKPGDFVLTCCWSGVPLHFMINANIQSVQGGQIPQISYQFEEESFDTIQNLINFYLTQNKFITRTSKAKLKKPIKRSMPLSYYDSKYGALSNLSTVGVYTPSQSPRPSPFVSPAVSPSTSPKMQRRTPKRTGSQPLLSVDEIRDTRIGSNAMDRCDSLPVINTPQTKHRSPSREHPVTRYHQRSGSEPVLMPTQSEQKSIQKGTGQSGSDSDLTKPPPPKPSRIPSIKYKQRPKVLVRNVALYEDDDGRDYSDYYQVKEEPSWAKGKTSLAPDIKTPTALTSPPKIYDNNFNTLKNSSHNLNSHTIYGKFLSNRVFPELDSPTKDIRYDEDIYNINIKYDTMYLKKRKMTKPVMRNSSSFNVRTSEFAVLPNDCKPLEAGSMIKLKSTLLEKDARVLALHCTKMDLDAVHVLTNEDHGMGVESGLELLTLPQGKDLRQDIIERCHCMKLFVIVSILTCSTVSERANMMSQWILISLELKLLGNLFSFVNVMDGLTSQQVSRLKTTRLILRQNHTNSAYTFDTKLKAAYKALNEGSSSLPLQNVCVPNINPLVYLLERDLDSLLNELTWERNNPVAGLDMFLTHLDTARVIAAQVELYQITGSAVMADFHGDRDILDMFDTAFHLKLLWGARGASVNRKDRHRKFDQLLIILSERAEASNDEGTAV